MSTTNAASPQRIANVLITALTDATFYLRDRYNQYIENALLRAIEEAERAEGAARRSRRGEEEEEELIGDREANEGHHRVQ